MKRYYMLFVMLSIGYLLQGQRQLDIQGNPGSPDTVASIKVNYPGMSNVVGLSVYSEPTSNLGIGGYFRGGYRGINGISSSGVGVYGSSSSGHGLHGISQSNFGLYSNSFNATGAFLRGGGGIALELGGVNSPYDSGIDDGVIHSQQDLISSDLIMVSNDAFLVKLDDDNNNSSHMQVINGANDVILDLNEEGKLALEALEVDKLASSFDTAVTIRYTTTSPLSIGGVGLAVIATTDTAYTFGGTFYSKYIGVQGSSYGGYGVSGESENGVGGRFKGGQAAIELVGTDSPYGTGTHEGVIRTTPYYSADMILVSNDAILLHLDEDDNSTSYLQVQNGDNNPILTLFESGNLYINGTYYSSDLNKKENIQEVDLRNILSKIENLPIYSWQFIGEDISHVGPMAQNFYKSFGLGSDECTIATVDADGIALAGIQALIQEINELKEQNKNLQKQLDELKEVQD